MDILRALLSTSLAHGSKLIVGLITLKLIAVYLGPVVMGYLGNLMSVISLVSSLAGGGIISGVIKYVAQYNKNPLYLSKFISSSFTYSLSLSVLISVFGIIFSKPLSQLIFIDDRYWPVIVLLSIAQMCMAINNLIVGILNGLGETTMYASIVVIGNALAIPFMFILIKYGGNLGAMVSLVISPILVLIPAFYFVTKSKLKKVIRFKYSSSFVKRLSHYSFMVFASATILPVSEILIRNKISSTLGITQVGMWQSLSRVGLAYVSFFTLFLSYYYMPRLSEAKNKQEIVNHVKQFSKLIIISISFVSLVIFVFRIPIIKIVLSDQFLGISDFLIYQLVGDALKITGYIFGFITVAKAATKLYVAAELIQGVGYVAFVSISSHFNLGFHGVMMSYVTTSAIYLLSSFIAFLFYSKSTGKV